MTASYESGHQIHHKLGRSLQHPWARWAGWAWRYGIAGCADSVTLWGHDLVGVHRKVLSGYTRVVYNLTLVALDLNRTGHKALRVGNHVSLGFCGLNASTKDYKKADCKEFYMFHVEPFYLTLLMQ